MFRPSVFLVSLIVWVPWPSQAARYQPPIAPASKEGIDRIQSFKTDPGLRIELIAAEPLLANPVAFTIDNRGEIYVAETFRHSKGVTDMRKHRSWLLDDLSSETIEDRLIAMKKNLGTEFASYADEHDRVRLLKDTDGDGIVDRATVFADGFRDVLAGIGSGLLEDRGTVYYTCIPDFWGLRDQDGDGIAEERELLSSGYGVHISLLGHDSHGLRKGPDGRIYFSIGDRGFNVQTEEGRLEYPHTGAVLRCEVDGSHLEVVHSGLRNPQELVFDNYGNLFTGDNNSDAGDQARWVYVVEGGESGWLIYHQWSEYPETRGIWMSEKIWYLEEEGQAAYFLPPLAHIGSGPSGLAYYDGTGLPEKYRDTFFLCDFRGTPVTSKIHAIRLKPKGASFELAKRWDFVTGNLPTDVDFGVGNGIYFSDWNDGWDQPLKGRIYRVYDPERENDPVVLETAKILGEGFAQRSRDELLDLLSHPNQRVRLEAQWALADLGEEAVPALIEKAAGPAPLLARLHAIWGLGQIGRTGPLDPEPIAALLSDAEMEVRAQSARVLGWIGNPSVSKGLIQSLRDPSPRVRFLAAISLGQIGAPEAFDPLLHLIEENGNRDRYLRHGAVMGLVGCGSIDRLTGLKTHSSPAVRLAAVLALRKKGCARVKEFLNDSDFFVVAEAARAINDTALDEGLPDLAACLERLPDPDSSSYDPLVRRAINANYRLGGTVHAKRLVTYALSREPDERRAEALMRLGEWGEPDGQDKVTGIWRPLAKRDPSIARTALENEIPALLDDPSPAVRLETMKLIATYRFQDHSRRLLSFLENDSNDETPKIEALKTLVTLESPLALQAIEKARNSDSPRVRSAAAVQIGRLNPVQAMKLFREVLDKGSIEERQSVLASLAEIDLPEAEEIVLGCMKRLIRDEVPKEIHLDILEAAQAKTSSEILAALKEYRAKSDPEDPLCEFRPALLGGNREKGKEIFFENPSTSCTRCHVIDGMGGGEVGPDLSHIAARGDREYILESIVFPNNRIAEGFENVTLTLSDDTWVSGRVLEENEETLLLEVTSSGQGDLEEDWDEDAFLESLDSGGAEAMPHSVVDVVAEGKTPPALERRTIEKKNIVDRKRNLSAMPENMALLLRPKEIRDLVEYLSSLK